MRTTSRVGRESSGSASTSTFASFAIPKFRIIWAGTFCYYLGIFSSFIARGALAKKLGGSNTALGIVTMAFGLVSLLMTPVGGVMADRWPKRRTLFVSTMMLAVSSLALGVTEWLDITRFWMLVVASGIQAMAFATLLPARMAFTAEIVGPKLIPNAVALAQISMNLNRVIGPAVAGAFLAVAWLSYTGVYFFAAVLATVSAACFLLLPPGLPNPNRKPRAPVAELVDGFRYARSDRSIFLVIGLAITVTMVGFPYVAFLPSVSEDFFGRGDSGYALLSLLGAVGGLAAGLVVASRPLYQGPRVQVLAGVTLAGGLLFMAWAPTFALSALAGAVVGGSTAAFQSMNATLALSLSDTEYHGRIQSLIGLGFSMFGLASLPLGMLADRVGLRQTLAGMGVAVAVFVIGGEVLWSMDRPDLG